MTVILSEVGWFFKNHPAQPKDPVFLSRRKNPSWNSGHIPFPFTNVVILSAAKDLLFLTECGADTPVREKA